METNDETRAGHTINPDQLQSDMDTIKDVLIEAGKKNDVHRIIIAAGNLMTAILLLIAVPILMFVPGIVGLYCDTPEVLTVSAAMLIPIVVLCVLAAPFLLAGWGLLKKKTWGNVFAVIAAILNITNVPVGTAFAIYTFWALAKGKLAARG